MHGSEGSNISTIRSEDRRVDETGRISNTYRIVSIFHKCIDSQECQIRLRLGVVYQVEINKLLKLEVFCRIHKFLAKNFKSYIVSIATCLDAINNIRKQRRYILSDSHISNDLFKMRILR